MTPKPGIWPTWRKALGALGAGVLAWAVLLVLLGLLVALVKVVL